MALKRIGQFIGDSKVVETEAQLPKVNIRDRFTTSVKNLPGEFMKATKQVIQAGAGLVDDLGKRGQNVYEKAQTTGQELSKPSAYTSGLNEQYQQPKGFGEKSIDVASLGSKVVGEIGGGVGDAFVRFFEAATSNVTPEQKKSILESKPVQDIKKAFAKENINPDVLAMVDSVSQKAKQNPEVAGAVNDFFNVVLNVTGGGAAENVLKRAGTETAGFIGDVAGATKTIAGEAITGVKTNVGGAVDMIGNVTGDVYKTTSDLKNRVQTLVAEKSVNPQLESSAQRLFADGTKRLEDPVTTYNKYVEQSKLSLKDIKVDPPISQVGENIGEAFNGVVKQRRSVGEVMGSELKKIGNLKADVSETFTNLETALKESGARYNANTGKLVLDKTSKFTAEDKFILESYVKELNRLGANPTIAQIDGLLSRTQGLVDNYKSSKGITQVTNGERLIKQSQNVLRNQFDPVKTGNPQLKAYSDARKAYADLSDFIDEGSGYLGTITQTGDFAKDASLAKSSVQSVLNNGKKDWLLRLEALTGYQALDESVLALQAMKDAGDFRGTSLLQIISDGNVPLTPSGFTQKVLDYAVSKGTELIAGTPEEQTRAYLKSLSSKAQIDSIKKPAATSPAKTGETTKSIKNKSNPIKLTVPQNKLKSKGIPNKQGGMINPGQMFDDAMGLLDKKLSPEKIAAAAKLISPEDFKIINSYLTKATIENVGEVEAIIKGMGINKLSMSQQDEFLKLALTKYRQSSPSVKLKVRSEKKGSPTMGQIDNLTQEARKYKTADEFVKAQQKLLHGTNKRFDKFDLSKSGNVQPSDWGNGAYFTDNIKNAKSFAKVAGGDVVLERYAPNVKYADGSKLLKNSDFMQVLDDGMGFKTPSEYLAEKGYGGVKFVNPKGFTEYVVFDTKNILTKAELEAIWKKANNK